MGAKQTPDKHIQSRNNLSPNSWKRLLDRVRRRIAFVPAVDDTVQSLKDVGIELKDNQL